MKNLFMLLTISLCCFQNVNSQKAKATATTIAIFPFRYSNTSQEYKSRAYQVQQAVIETLQQKSGIEIIDRSMDSLLVKELDLQIREQSIAADGLVQQGKLLGAKQMITGTLSNITVDSKRKSNLNLLNKKNTTVTEFNAAISFALQLSDVETGKIVSQKLFNSKDGNAGKLLSFTNLGTGESREEAVTNAINSCKKQISSWLNETYVPEIKILKIDERDKKGYPGTVLVTGIDASLPKGTQITVSEVELIDAGDGKSLRRTKKIAELKIAEMQGEISICRVTDGEKILEEKMKAGAKMEFAVKKSLL